MYVSRFGALCSTNIASRLIETKLFNSGVERRHELLNPYGLQPGNRTLAHTVAAREFCEGSSLRTAVGLGLLRRRQFRGTAHMLPALLRPAAAFGGAGADEIAL